MEDQPAPTLIGCQALEQFVLLAKSAKGPAVAELINHATASPGVYVFGELLECECVKAISSGPHAKSVRLLEIFAYGTYDDYKSECRRQCMHLIGGHIAHLIGGYSFKFCDSF